ncbi:hypothetical protein GBAR_LOCUS9535 [Geodia barretti]|uniref:Uncharacterized protein n=1 Tax=Geodia barretti TaxID=519541 RepID=A0AA35WFH8_GEOBA|nr:hypothetical protein GBAR_LOCUS9535 [Geodia barretti]
MNDALYTSLFCGGNLTVWLVTHQTKRHSRRHLGREREEKKSLHLVSYLPNLNPVNSLGFHS